MRTVWYRGEDRKLVAKVYYLEGYWFVRNEISDNPNREDRGFFEKAHAERAAEAIQRRYNGVVRWWE